MAPRTQFQANQVSDFNAGWYLGEYSDIGNAFDDWASQQPMNFDAYVRGTPDLEAEWNKINDTRIANAPYLAQFGPPQDQETRVKFGTNHWNLWGAPDSPGNWKGPGGENRAMAYDLGDNYYIMSKDLANDPAAKNTFAAWHFDTTGRNEPNRYGTESAFDMSQPPTTPTTPKPIPGSPFFPERRFRTNQVAGFDADWYLDNPIQDNQDVLDSFNQWSTDYSGMHFGDYVRTNTDLEDAWSSTYDQHDQSRWDWGETHWADIGSTQEGLIKPLIIGDRTVPGDTRTIWTGSGQDQAQADYAAYHFDTTGRNEGKFGNETSWYMSPEQQGIRDDADTALLQKFEDDNKTLLEEIAADDRTLQEEIAVDDRIFQSGLATDDRTFQTGLAIRNEDFLEGIAAEDRTFQTGLADRNELFLEGIEDDRKIAATDLKIETARLAEEDRLFQLRMADVQKVATQKAAARAESSRLASSRGGGSQTLSASGAATFKGKGLKSSANKRGGGGGRGTGQFRRPYSTSNLSIAAPGKGNQQSTLNL